MLAITQTLPTRKSPNTFSLTFEWVYDLNVKSAYEFFGLKIGFLR